jgi:peptide/nickel transport system ATP-binding protein
MEILGSLLDVDQLVAGYYTPTGVLITVTGVSFQVQRGEIFAIVGESGCGKTTLAAAIYRILKYPGMVFHGKVSLNGTNLLDLREEELREIRMKRISYVPQYAMDALDPVTRVGDFMKRALLEHGFPSDQMDSLIKDKLRLMRLPEKVFNMYPVELSGGMRQRVVLATSLLLDPDLVILDEPTTGLDVVVQYGILKDFKAIQRERGFSTIIISHDLPMIMMLADRVAIMYAGEFVEIGKRDDLLNDPRHPYTSLLLRSVPSIVRRSDRLLSIPGGPPLLTSIPTNCRFNDRCPYRQNICLEKHPILTHNGDPTHLSRCFVTADPNVSLSRMEIGKDFYVMSEELGDVRPIYKHGEVVLTVEGLSKIFMVSKGLLKRAELIAVDDVSFQLKSGVVTALVGGSGHGKSTIARILAGIETQTSGKILVDGVDASSPSFREKMWYKSRVQMVFQDPYSSLDPRHTVKWHIERPLLLHGKVGKGELEGRIKEVLNEVGLRPPERYMEKYPHQISGGERQRVAIGRALAVEPKVLIADEPVSMLDASVRAGVLNLLKGLKRLGVSILYITHDIATVSYIADELMVIYNGKLVERGDVWTVISNPTHEYTKQLIEAVPDPYKRI